MREQPVTEPAGDELDALIQEATKDPVVAAAFEAAEARRAARRPVLERRGREVALTVGEAALLDRLWDEGQDVARLERALAAARGRRELLIHKAHRRGFSTREIGRIGSLTSTAVSLIYRKGFRRNGI